MKEHTTYWIKHFMQDPDYCHLRFKKLDKGFNGYPPFDIDDKMIDSVDLQTFIKKEDTRIPLLIGTQMGIYPRIDEISHLFREDLIFAILEKSVLSGCVAGLGIHKLPTCSYLHDREKLRYFKNVEIIT